MATLSLRRADLPLVRAVPVQASGHIAVVAEGAHLAATGAFLHQPAVESSERRQGTTVRPAASVDVIYGQELGPMLATANTRATKFGQHLSASALTPSPSSRVGLLVIEGAPGADALIDRVARLDSAVLFI